MQNVGITLDWVRNLLGATWEELYATAARPRRPDAPRFDPHLTPERWNPGATGAWTGLTLACEREDLDAQRPGRGGGPAAAAPR